VITGSSCSRCQCTPSAERKGISPDRPLPPSALKRCPGGAAGLPSMNGEKLCEAGAWPFRMTLFSSVPPTSKIFSAGFRQRMPSSLSA
jgi:hypothetical protein